MDFCFFVCLSGNGNSLLKSRLLSSLFDDFLMDRSLESSFTLDFIASLKASFSARNSLKYGMFHSLRRNFLISWLIDLHFCLFSANTTYVHNIHLEQGMSQDLGHITQFHRVFSQEKKTISVFTETVEIIKKQGSFFRSCL